MRKKIVKYLLILFSVLILGSALFFYIIIPQDEIKELQNKYVINSKTGYLMQKKRPDDWVDIKKINKKALNAIVVSEDWFFYRHFGIDLSQIKEAFSERFWMGKPLRGASTITQQLVKNLFLSNEKKIIRKIEEMVLAIYAETVLSKSRILEIYVNIINYGENIYGIKQASEFYFQRMPSEIGAKEGAFLAMLLPSPANYSQSFRNKALSDYAEKTINKILEKMVMGKYLTQEEKNSELSRKFDWEVDSSNP